MKKTTLITLFLVLSQFALAQFAFAITPFTITDIRVEGLERLDEGTVFNYLPLKVGDKVDDEETRLSIKELFKIGFFKAVSLGQDGTTLVVTVVERPSIASITFNGNSILKTEALEQGLEQVGMVEGRIFNTAHLEQVKQDIKNAYLSLGRYSASVDVSVEDLDQNRVAITLDINEGRVARIKKINIIGAESISAKKIKDEMQLKEKRGYRIFSRQDQYSKQKLEADIETIRSYYLNRGYYEFELVSSNFEISPNKQNIFISIVIDEGEVYTFGESTIEGVDEDEVTELQKLIGIKSGQSFSRQAINQTRLVLTDYFANDGFAFVETRSAFDTDQYKKVVNVVFSIIPNQRVTVRRIDISGNTFTRDEVVRRELRQIEGAWYSASAIKRSKTRLQRLGFFGSVKIETLPVAGTTDQVDMKVIVTEVNAGSVAFKAGYSDEKGTVFGIEFEQRNLLGTGRHLSTTLNKEGAATTASIAYTNPYYTQDGISRGFSISTSKVDSADASTAPYKLSSNAASLFYTVPIAETNAVNFEFSFETLAPTSTGKRTGTSTETSTGTPDAFRNVINKNKKAQNLIFKTGFSKDTRNNFFFPTHGAHRSISLEASAPGSDFTYYKLDFQETHYLPVGDNLTLKGKFNLGYGGGYGSSGKTGLPFYKYYFAGGESSVRGYEANSLGPRPKENPTGDPTGGSSRVLINVEALFPTFGANNSNDKRLGLFIDGGMVYGGLVCEVGDDNICGEDDPVYADSASIKLGEMRYSAGIFFHWFSAIGPFKISYGVPFNDKPGDEYEKLKISVGTSF